VVELAPPADRRPRPTRDTERPREHGRDRSPRHHDDEPSSPPVVGLGDHVPAFLLRPVPKTA
jgi:hypothetical protein